MKRRSNRPSATVAPPGAGMGITPVVILDAPQPVVPDEVLRQELSAADTADLWALFTVNRDGNSDVMLLSSTGSDVLDKYGLDAARRWRFRAARKKGKPVPSYLRLHIAFSIE